MHCKKRVESKIRVKSNPSFFVGVALLITYTESSSVQQLVQLSTNLTIIIF